MLLKGSGENDMHSCRIKDWNKGKRIGIFLERNVDDLYKYLTTSQLFLLKQDLSSNGDLSNWKK